MRRGGKEVRGAPGQEDEEKDVGWVGRARCQRRYWRVNAWGTGRCTRHKLASKEPSGSSHGSGAPADLRRARGSCCRKAVSTIPIAGSDCGFPLLSAADGGVGSWRLMYLYLCSMSFTLRCLTFLDMHVCGSDLEVHFCP